VPQFRKSSDEREAQLRRAKAQLGIQRLAKAGAPQLSLWFRLYFVASHISKVTHAVVPLANPRYDLTLQNLFPLQLYSSPYSNADPDAFARILHHD
jgi:hypothetical protein